MADGREELADVVVVELVERVPTLAAGAHETEAPQDAEVVRGRARAERGRGGERLDGAGAARELGEDAQSAGGAERLQRLREVLGLVGAELKGSGGVLGRVRHTPARIERMSKSAHVISRLFPATLLLTLAWPATASAHALFGSEDPNRPVIEYLTLGFAHMVGGWDHLLFITGVVLIAGSLRTAAKLISLFVAGHSLTLLVATLAEWQLDATVVDVVIALSLVYVGVQGFLGRPASFRVFGSIVFAFGLVHGLGLSTRLQDLGLPDGGLVGRVLLFNVGVELGQLVALAVIVGIGTLLVRHSQDVRDREEELRRYGYFSIAVSGLVAAAVISFSAAEDSSSDTEELAGGACTVEQTTPTAGAGGGHPERQFYGPTDDAPDEDFTHVIGDGYVIVRYRPDLGVSDLRALERLVLAPGSRQYVVAAPDPEQTDALRAVTASRTLVCAGVSLGGLTEFRDEWFAELGQQ